MVFFIVNRGLLAPNCFWWKMSDILLDDPNGVNLYNKLKNIYGDFPPINIMGTKIIDVINSLYCSDK